MELSLTKVACFPQRWSTARKHALIRSAMRITFAYMVLVWSSIQVMTANPGISQELQQMTVTISAHQESLKTVLKRIEEKTGLSFVMPMNEVETYTDVSLPKMKRDLKSTLDLILSNTHLGYRQINKRSILIYVKERVDANKVLLDVSFKGERPISLELPPVKGKVVDEKGEGLPGVNILIKGTQQGTISDENGYFQLNVQEGATLIFSFVGYITQELPVTNSTNLQVVLKSDSKALEEVIVVGYGTQKKSDLTGTVASVPQERFEMIPNVNIAQAIQGAVPGVMVQTTSAGAEPNQAIMIRGRNSIKADNSPLIIVDGVPYRGNIMDINPNDVKSIEILKDASSAAIYGSRGANGVILVTTKQGVKGSLKVSYDVKLATQSHTNLPKVMNGEEFYQFKEQRRSGLITQTEREVYDSGEWVDWYKLSTRKGYSQHHELSISGATDRLKYYLSGGLLDVQGISINDNYKRLSGRANFEMELTKWMTLGTRTQVSSINKSGIAPNFEWVYYSNPLVRPYDDNGNLSVFPWPGNQDISNPLESILWENLDKSFQIISNNYLSIDFPFVKGLNYKLNTGIRSSFSQMYIYRGRNSTSGFTQNGSMETNRGGSNNLVVENVLSYQRAFDKHSVFGTIVYGFEKNESGDNRLTARGFPHDFLGIYSASQAQLIQPSYSYQYSHLISQMLRLNYAYDSRYLITLTGRRDGFSGFGANTKWGIFPSVALGWNIANEDFFPAKGLFTELKIRASLGLNGNQAVGPYQTISRLASRDMVYNRSQVAGYIPSVLGQEDLGWETSKTYNLGVDYGILNDRVTGSLNLFQTNTFELLLDRAISPVHGLSSITQNIGKTQNQGIELSVDSRNITSNNFTWFSSINFSLLKNKIVDLYGDGLDDIVNGWFIGQPILVNYDFEVDGIWQKDEAEEAAKWGSKPGYVKIKDLNKDDKLTAGDDRKIIGQRDPRFLWGFTNTLSYKNFNLNFFIHGVHGSTRTSGLMTDEETWAEIRRNTIVKDWWTDENPSNKWVRNEIGAERMAGIKSTWYEKADFVRLKDITLSYDLSRPLIERLKLDRLRIYISGRNIFTATNWTGLDPELNSQLATPLQKEFLLGLNITF